MRNIAQEVYGCDLRDNQRHFLKFYRDNQNKNIIAEMPTGSGKSLIAMHIGLNHPDLGTVFIVTKTKDLMRQYERDFGSLKGVLLLAGKNEYKCLDSEELNSTAESCTHDDTDNPCDYHFSMDRNVADCCEYSKRINTFMDHKVVVTNYHMMMALIRIRMNIQWHSPLIIWDEGHNFADIIRDMAGIEYNKDWTARNTNEDLAENIYDFIQNKGGKLNKIVSDLSIYQDKYNTKDGIHIKRRLDNLETRLNQINQYDYLDPEPYEIVRYDGKRESCIRIIPVNYTQLTKATFANAATNHLIMSGTIHYPKLKTNERLEVLEKITGMPMDTIYITPQKYHFKQDKIKKIAPRNLDHIYYSNSNKYSDFKRVYEPLIKLIIDSDVNTMIHFNAVWQCNHMKRALKDSGYNKNIYNYHEYGNDTQLKQKIKKDFIRTGGVIIGSSLHEGLDFPGKQLEMVVIGRAKFIPSTENNKFYPGKKKCIPNKLRKIWEGLEQRGVKGIDREEYRLVTLQQIGRLQRKSDDEGLVVLCNYRHIHKDIAKHFKLVHLKTRP